MSASTFCRRPHSVSYLKPQATKKSQHVSKPWRALELSLWGNGLGPSPSFASGTQCCERRQWRPGRSERSAPSYGSTPSRGLGFPHRHRSPPLPRAAPTPRAGTGPYSLHSEVISSHPVVINIQKDLVSLHGCTQDLEKKMRDRDSGCGFLWLQKALEETPTWGHATHFFYSDSIDGVINQ